MLKFNGFHVTFNNFYYILTQKITCVVRKVEKY